LHFPAPTHEFNGSTIGFRDKNRMNMDLPLFSADGKENAIGVWEAISDLPKIKSGERATTYDCPPLNGYQRERRQASTHTLTLHESTAHSDKMLEIIRHSGPNISYIPKNLISSGFSSSYSRLDANDPSVTITVNFVHPASNRCIHPKCDRALTPREGARLQSFNDDYIFKGTRSQIVKQIGNAVPPILGHAIGLAVSKILNIKQAQQSTRANDHMVAAEF
jgi:DNA (cytosine-5)-methyltransferase 1